METLEIIFQLCPNWFKICYKSLKSSPPYKYDVEKKYLQ